MDTNLLVGCKVAHRVYGTGEITDISNARITVQFKSARKMFVFPDAFNGYLVLKTTKDLQKQVEKELQDKDVLKDSRMKELNATYRPKRKVASKTQAILMQVPYFNEMVCSEDCMKHNIARSTSPCANTDCARLKAKGDKKLLYCEVSAGLVQGRYDCLAQTFYEQQKLTIPNLVSVVAGQVVIFVAIPPKSNTADLTVYGCAVIDRVVKGETSVDVYFDEETFVLLSEEEMQGITCVDILNIKDRLLFTGKIRRITAIEGSELLLRITDNITAEDERAETVKSILLSLKN